MDITEYFKQFMEHIGVFAHLLHQTGFTFSLTPQLSAYFMDQDVGVTSVMLKAALKKA